MSRKSLLIFVSTLLPTVMLAILFTMIASARGSSINVNPGESI